MQNGLLDNLIHHAFNFIFFFNLMYALKDGQNRDLLLSAKGNKLSVISWERI